MKETGIIMSGDHPKLILDGIKTMTRRVIKPQPTILAEYAKQNTWGRWDFFGKHQAQYGFVCPYGQVGDRLWVRETFSDIIFQVSDSPSSDYIYKAQWDKPLPHNGKWKPSIFMPRRASRITRDIVLSRAERLRDISEADAKAEGGYSVEEFIKVFLHLNHLPEDANPWDWVIGW